MSEDASAAVSAYLSDLQTRICRGLEAADGTARFDTRSADGEGVQARPRVLSDGPVLERAAVMFSHARGPALPPAATARRPELAGRRFEAVVFGVLEKG